MSTTAEKEILGLSYSSNPTAEKIGETFAYCLFFFYRYKTRTCRSIRRDITKFTTNTLITNYKESKTTLHYTTLHYTTLHYTTLQGFHNLFNLNLLTACFSCFAGWQRRHRSNCLHYQMTR